jgi:hypothetical protein
MSPHIDFRTSRSYWSVDKPLPLFLEPLNGPISECIQRVCHDTLPWLISVSLGIVVCHEKD